MFYSGIILFFGVHLIPLNSNIKEILKNRLGENIYKGLFSLISLFGFLLIIFGYESGSDSLYLLNTKVFLFSGYIMFLSITVIIAANLPTYIKIYTKHPMSLGIAIWSGLHLLTNSDISSLVLFGTFLVYSLVSVVSAELRKPKAKQRKPRIMFDSLSVFLGVILTWLAYNYHGYLSGVDLL